jgi:hypothetical protein
MNRAGTKQLPRIKNIADYNKIWLERKQFHFSDERFFQVLLSHLIGILSAVCLICYCALKNPAIDSPCLCFQINQPATS